MNISIKGWLVFSLRRMIYRSHYSNSRGGFFYRKGKTPFTLKEIMGCYLDGGISNLGCCKHENNPNLRATIDNFESV